jgi:hypothetical protein
MMGSRLAASVYLAFQQGQCRGAGIPPLAGRQRLGRERRVIDLHGIGAGERWRERLRKANAACEAVVLLASPNSLGSVECEKELELAEALGKPIIPVIVRDLTVKHPRLAPWADRQIVDLSQQPAERIEPFEHEGQFHRVEFSVAALASIKARLADSASRPAASRGSRASGPTARTPAPIPASPGSGRTTPASSSAARQTSSRVSRSSD